jgi:HD-GYP domain-containing protein (c-di-GMP phosphodiesterase class II)
VDIYDAMRSDRPYRKGFNKLQTVESIRLLSGTHLDPQAVEYFLSLSDIYK